MENITLWRINLRTDGDSKLVEEHCFSKCVVGIGWPVDGCPQEPDEYEKMARGKHGKKVASIRFATEMQIGDLVWSRNLTGCYFLGRIEGEWLYSDKKKHLDLDIPNQRKCCWIDMGAEDKVPGKIANQFRGQALRRINGDKMLRFSKMRFNQESKSDVYDVKCPGKLLENSDDFFELISWKDCEDLVALYLQEKKGFHLIPSTCKRSTPAYEFVLKHRETGEEAVVQVKQGDTDINDKELPDGYKKYLFSTEGKVILSRKESTRIDPEELYKFAMDNKLLLTKSISYWIDS